jgi:hypothetical protein
MLLRIIGILSEEMRMEYYEKHDVPAEIDLDKIRKEKLGSYGGYDFWYVDGEYIKDERIDIDFTSGGNPGRYGYIPEGDIWLDPSSEGIGDDVPNGVHEYIECNLMINDGLSYDEAHEFANEVEKVVRELEFEGSVFDNIVEILKYFE